jgi:hypothetical protein
MRLGGGRLLARSLLQHASCRGAGAIQGSTTVSKSTRRRFARAFLVQGLGFGVWCSAEQIRARTLTCAKSIAGTVLTYRLLRQREQLYEMLVADKSVLWAATVVDHRRIDEINILASTMEAMKKSVEGLAKAPSYVLIDGNR